MELIEELKSFDEEFIQKINEIAKNNIDYWDIRLGLKIGTNLEYNNQKKKEFSEYKILDCSIRTFFNGGWGFVTSQAKTKKSLISDFKKAISLAKLSESLCKSKFKIKYGDPIKKEFKIKIKKPLEKVDIEDKINLIRIYEQTAYNYSSEVKNTRSIYLDEKIQKLFINSIGSSILQDLSYLRLIVVVSAQKNGISQSSVNSTGGIGGFEITKTNNFENIWLKTAKEAVDLLSAKSPISGRYTIIMDPKLTGTFIHETVGHSCEADLVLKRESILESKIGEKIANDEINIIDNPSIGVYDKFNLPHNLCGCYFIDDEGILAQETVIIENGILKNYLHNLETASKMNLFSNGHGIADSIVSKPLVRMGFTYLKPKDWDLDEMIEDVKKGLLCSGFQYGYTDTGSGNFSFKTKISFSIEKGERKDLFRDISISGSFLDILKKVSAVGKSFDYLDGLCSKNGQNTLISSGGPFIRIEDVKV